MLSLSATSAGVSLGMPHHARISLTEQEIAQVGIFGSARRPFRLRGCTVKYERKI